MDIEKLKSGENFHTWEFAMRNVLAMKGFEKCIVEGEDAEKAPKKLAECKALLSLSVDQCLYVHIQNCESAVEVWNKLKEMFQDNGLSRKIALLRNMISTRLEECDNM